MPYKRKRPSVTRAVRTALRVGNVKSLASAGRSMYKRRRTGIGALQQQVNALTRTIETKEGNRNITNIQLAHNNLTVLNDSGGNPYNPFVCGQGASDPMGGNAMNRIGDEIVVKSLVIKFYVECSLMRNNTHFKFFFVKMAKGDTLNRTNFFKDCCANKMIDQVNTERFTVLATKTIQLTQAANVAPATISTVTGLGTTTSIGIGATRIVSMRIPGVKFGRKGVCQYENGSTTQIKFFDYRLCCVAYDWYGTPQDVNNVGFINDGFCKLYYKDA